jgi:hypothetical protein
MATVKQYIDIKASMDEVFALVIDAERRSKLNPKATLLAMSHYPEGQIKEGTIFNYRVIVEGKVIEYKNTCIGLEQNRYFETQTDTEPPFRVKLSIEKIGDKIRLTQEEQFSLPKIHLSIPQSRGLLGKFIRQMFGNEAKIDQDPELHAQREAEYSVKLNSRLILWLEAIKTHLETESSRIYA